MVLGKINLEGNKIFVVAKRNEHMPVQPGLGCRIFGAPNSLRLLNNLLETARTRELRT
jgi:hypothetical protein